ncbi:MAG: acetyl-CoA carboxylase biotin carboxylase subunit [Chloroflexi bacterium]|nr:acetyl-CoA carboxylase biotin carboxylase subunit [Chloroflexota bacterium]
MITSILIANRGEIACRIIRTCRSMGIRTVAVFSDADTQARHVLLADEAIHIGPSPVGDSYLAMDKIIAAAQRADAEAIHPGFGFLAENEAFAQAVIDAGLIFIGPTPAAMAAMGNKRAAKELAAAVGVPTVPGYSGADQSDGRFQQEAARIGYPLMVKAAAGGGGKGMRAVTDPAHLVEALASARREAQQAFGSGELLLEKLLVRPRHIEFQVIGDTHGQVIHLGERECSIQRRHQKVIEETPSPALTPELRAAMGATAVAAAQAVHYTNAGTVEMLLDADGNYYFLEMNTRLQVEHPVTEMVTGVDLVEWQIKVAEGQPLPLAQEQIVLRGHAIEARVYAENPANDFLPVTGDILLWREPGGDGVRVDSGLQPQDTVSIHYDPMLAKVIAHGEDRATAVRRLLRALQTTTLLGLTTNLTFLQDILRHPAFQSGDLHTGFIGQHLPEWQPPTGDVDLALLAAAVAQASRQPQPATSTGYWRNNPNAAQRYRFAMNGETMEVQLFPAARRAGGFQATIAADNPLAVYDLVHGAFADNALTLTVNGRRQTLALVLTPTHAWAHTPTGVVVLEIVPLLPKPRPSAEAGGSLRAPMPGSVLAVLVQVGDQVVEGQPLMKLEAMKMEHTIRTAADGIVEAIYFQPGDTVEADAQLLKIGSGTEA